jgi:hypothetical protein
MVVKIEPINDISLTRPVDLQNGNFNAHRRKVLVCRTDKPKKTRRRTGFQVTRAARVQI